MWALLAIEAVLFALAPSAFGVAIVQPRQELEPATGLPPDLPSGPDVNINAIIPTKSPQIGINPWEYHPKITVNTEYLTEIITATIKNGPAPTPTVAPPLATATRVGDDLNVYFAPAFVDKLVSFAEAAPACSLLKRVEACELYSFMKQVQASGELETLEAQLQLAIYEAMEWAIDGTTNLIQLLAPASFGQVVRTLQAAGVFYGGAVTAQQVLPIFYENWRAGQDSFAKSFGGAAFRTADVKEIKTPVNTAKPEENTCPKDIASMPSCEAESCKGDAQTEICTTDGCPCGETLKELVQRIPLRWAITHQIIVDHKPPPFGNGQVLKQECLSFQRYDFNIEVWKQMAASFCSGRNLRGPLNETFTNMYSFNFNWNPNPSTINGDCTLECSDMFNYYMSDQNLGCMFGFPNTISGGGTQENTCGNANWAVTIPNANIITPPPIPVDDPPAQYSQDVQCFRGPSFITTQGMQKIADFCTEASKSENADKGMTRSWNSGGGVKIFHENPPVGFYPDGRLAISIEGPDDRACGPGLGPADAVPFRTYDNCVKTLESLLRSPCDIDVNGSPNALFSRGGHVFKGCWSWYMQAFEA